jgi:hypothetical protein
MFEEISPERALAMSPQEQRWFDNIKKAFYDGDVAYRNGQFCDECLPKLCAAIDTAKTLRLSLRGEGVSSKHNKARFVEFLECELPRPEAGGFEVNLVHARSGGQVTLSLAEFVYAIRCMIHENENLNAAESPDYHIVLDWDHPRDPFFGSVQDGRFVCNGHHLWHRLRQILAKFITGIDGFIAVARIKAGDRSGSFSITCEPSIGSVRPMRAL